MVVGGARPSATAIWASVAVELSQDAFGPLEAHPALHAWLQRAARHPLHLAVQAFGNRNLLFALLRRHGRGPWREALLTFGANPSATLGSARDQRSGPGPEPSRLGVGR